MPFTKLLKVDWDPAKSDSENIAAGALWAKSDTDKIDANSDYAQSELDSLGSRVTTLENGNVTQDFVNQAISSAIADAYDPPCIATVASASTVLFAFNEDGTSFNFLGGTFGWFATHAHRGVVTTAAALNIPFVTGRVILLDITNENNPTLTTRALGPSMTLSNNEYIIGNMFNDGTSPAVPTVVINGAGTYRFTGT